MTEIYNVLWEFLYLFVPIECITITFWVDCLITVISSIASGIVIYLYAK